jgi:hypothetical protein
MSKAITPLEQKSKVASPSRGDLIRIIETAVADSRPLVLAAKLRRRRTRR